MALLCNISSEVPENPVLCLKSNLIYERRLIEKHIHQFGTDPVTNEPATVDDLVNVKTGRVIRPTSKNTASVPGMLLAVQDEWDALALQNFTLKQQLHVTRQELSHALYQHDAACRLIARLQKELTSAKQALTAIKSSEHTTRQEPAAATLASTPTGNRAENNGVTIADAAAAAQLPSKTGEALSDDDVQKINKTAIELSEIRKTRNKDMPSSGLSTEQIVSFSEQKRFPLHSVSQPGITCMDLHYGKHYIATGGNDKDIMIFDKRNEHIITTLHGHTARISRVRWLPREDANVVVSASHDHTMRIWSVAEQNFLFQLNNHSAPVTGLSVHPTGHYVLSGGADGLWTMSSTQTGQLLLRNMDADKEPIQDCTFHADGKLLACALRSGVSRIYDAASNTCVASLGGEGSNTSAVTALCFSENGYHYYVAHQGAAVVCWDLRKLKMARSIDLPRDSSVNDIHVDFSAKFLGLAGTGQVTGLYQCKGMQALLPLDSHGGGSVTGIRFAFDSSYVVTTSLDRYLRLFY